MNMMSESDVLELPDLDELEMASFYESEDADYDSEFDEDEDDGEVWIDKVVRLTVSGVWHGVSAEHEDGAAPETYCGRPIPDTSAIKTTDPADEICKACVRQFDYGSARYFIAEALSYEQAKALDNLSMVDFDRGYLRRTMQGFIDKGLAHRCGVLKRSNATLYRKGPRNTCPDPKYHG